MQRDSCHQLESSNLRDCGEVPGCSDAQSLCRYSEAKETLGCEPQGRENHWKLCELSAKEMLLVPIYHSQSAKGGYYSEQVLRVKEDLDIHVYHPYLGKWTSGITAGSGKCEEFSSERGKDKWHKWNNSF